MGMGPDQVGQDVRVPGVALGSRHPTGLAGPGRLQRVDCVDLVTRRDQRSNPRAAVGLDPDRHLARISILSGAGVLGQEQPDHLVEPSDSRNPFRQAGFDQPLAGLILDLHIVVILSPVITDEQHPVLRSARPSWSAACRKTRDLMVK